MMDLSPTDSHLFSGLFADALVTQQLSDAQFVRHMLEVEAALSAVQGRLGIIPAEAANQIVAAIETCEVDFDQLRAGLELAGVPVIDLVRQLRAHAGEEAADYVHWGATSQDIVDTARVLQIRSILEEMGRALDEVVQNLAQLAAKHRRTLMAGRTHSQQALPIPFGLKVAGWLAPLLRHRQRLQEMRPRLLRVQFGGAAGTLAALGNNGIAVMSALAAELDLNEPLLPWHTQRDTFAELASWLSLVSGSLAKMAQDVILMAQSEVGELRETADASRGGSSTMPQKNNPVVSELIVAAARTNASLLAAMHQAQVQEHERATHGWQMEWLTLPQMLALTAGTLKRARFLSDNLVVDEARMRANVELANGLMLAEAITYALAPAFMSRAAAKQLVKEACQEALQEGRHLIDVMRAKTEVSLDWQAIRDESTHFGAADAFLDRVLDHCSGV
jgi:3-carboxy-cis,cis-muconate cycloisomerase